MVRSEALSGRGLLTMRHHSADEIKLILERAADLKELKRKRIFHHHLTDRNIAAVFLQPSCRTRTSLIVAANDEGAHAEIFPAEDIRLGIKESVKDVARMLGRLFDGIAFRAPDHRMIEAVARWSGVPVWNALSDLYHPTQVLADLLTIREEFGSLENEVITYVGDGRNNQVRSLVVAAAKLGLDLRVLAPKRLHLSSASLRSLMVGADESRARVAFTDAPGDALPGASVVYGDVWVSMSDADDVIDGRISLLRPYRITSDLMAMTERDDTILLHCLPALHNLETDFARRHPDVLEVDDDVFEGPRSRVFDQAGNRMHTIKALMVLSIGG